MARRTTPPFRADHVGSLLRPSALHRARTSHAAGAVTAAQLRRAEDDAIRDAVRMQEEAGLGLTPPPGTPRRAAAIRPVRSRGS